MSGRTPTLTVGMATNRDYDGVYFTVQSLRMHAGLPEGSEIVVVDNAPESKDGQALQKLCANFWRGAVKYVSAPALKGTAAPRDLLFRVARNEVVLCLDCHVLLVPGAIDALLGWYARNPDSADLVQGPLLYDDLRQGATHFSDEWGGGMWGRWAQGGGEDGEPFEIPAMGLGLFACRKDAWLGFNPRFRGFGGEEWYIHEKYRRAGRKTWCLPGLKWVHRFRPEGWSPGWAEDGQWTTDNKAWNYVVGLTELGIPLERARAHFLTQGITEARWEEIVEESKRSRCGACSGAKPPQLPPKADPPAANEGWSEQALKADPGTALVRKSAAGKVVQFSDRRGPDTLGVLAAGGVTRFVSYSKDTPPALEGKTSTEGRVSVTVSARGWREVAPEPCDLLLVSCDLPAGETAELLARHAPGARKVVVAGTARREAAVEGILLFLRKERGWRVADRDGGGRGYTLLDRDLTPLPSLWRRARNYALATLRRWLSRDPYGSLKGRAFELRLATCEVCPSRSGGHCAECGCPIDKKASLPTERCPLGKWGAEA